MVAFLKKGKHVATVAGVLWQKRENADREMGENYAVVDMQHKFRARAIIIQPGARASQNDFEL
jgi:hypothetical protein